MIHKNAEGLPLYLFDRSRLECATKDCLRKYYYLYGFMGIGIVKVHDIPPYWPFITGSFIHEGIELVLKGYSGKDAATISSSSYKEKWAPLISALDIPPERQA